MSDQDRGFIPSCSSCYGQNYQPAALRAWQISFVTAHVYYADSGYVQVTRAAKIIHPHGFDMPGEPKPKLYHCNYCGNLFTAEQAEIIKPLPPVEPPTFDDVPGGLVNFSGLVKKSPGKFLIATKRRVKKPSFFFR